MMRSYSVYDLRTGHIGQKIQLSSKSDVIVGENEGLIEGHYYGMTQWIDNGEVKDRPATGLPDTHTLPRDTDWTVPDVPEGAEVVIDGHSAGTVDGDGLVLSFPEPGEYRVELRPPFPWRSATCEVTVQ